ncbi:ABC transporter ATP-binding protein [Lachnospiraceae bacterium]|uniref:ABC transporter ATP-binding protein n=1 Tax=Extibacter sp. GGCC_0201 TaxID=2731209 RepID=UPI001AA0B3A8|nr:ABC transporter ATP-binding protein [Extibacter sp. GGCC_0201]MBO1719341.1 ABC transporter ATP-binding protein [Extibacter sp. GGCC_0201]BDF32501.1 ABC transporter ATP-binding protein [Lachnospiraceae bacterium]BDF36511.1 ABC transporter ATP-binding protein [Lachnospiraceae bacterium]
MAIMQVKEVTYCYTSGRPVLKGVNMTLEAGKVYVILGPSGCGKTTLLSLMGGLDIPSSGQILFHNQDIAQIGLGVHRRKDVAFIFQNYNLIDYMTPKENVELTAVSDPVSMLKQVGLTDIEMKRSVLKLSGGQQQRVAIARALASEAPIILADEPTGNLDEQTSAEITRLLKEKARNFHKCVVIVSHSKEVAKQSDQVFRLSDGKISVFNQEQYSEEV